MNTAVVTRNRRAEACALFGIEEREAPLPKFQLLQDSPADMSELFEPGFFNAERLLSVAGDLPFLNLQAIHLCQALIHLFITLATMFPPNKDITREDLQDCIALDRIAFDLGDIFTAMQKYSGDDEHAPRSQWRKHFEEIFIRLCTQRHGTSDIIRSEIMFLKLQELDHDIGSARSRRRTGEAAKASSEERYGQPQGIERQDPTSEPSHLASIQNSVASSADKGTLSAPPSQDIELEALQLYPPSFFQPLLDALNKAYQVSTSHYRVQSVHHSIVEQELPHAARAELGLTFQEYVSAAARAGIIVTEDSGDGTWIALKSVGSEGPLTQGHPISRGESSGSTSGAVIISGSGSAARQ